MSNQTKALIAGILIGLVAVLLLFSFFSYKKPTSSDNPFIHAQGQELVIGTDQTPIRLRGVNFNNYYWLDNPEDIINSDHHTEQDFQRVKDMGMNVIRFALNYKVLETEEGWQWLDKNIQWAKDHDLYLILDMHMPPGGYQGGSDQGKDLWETDENQAELENIWKTIAERYKEEPTIAAYDFLNEPTPTEFQQWETLTQRLTSILRDIDPHHLFIIEQSHDKSLKIPEVTDDNVMYDIHFYNPSSYTHQYSRHTGRGDGGFYPNPHTSIAPADTEPVETIQNPTLPQGDSEWNFYEGALHQITDASITTGVPSLHCDKNSGKAYFDNFIINEYDKNKNFIRTITSIDIESNPENSHTTTSPYLSDPKFWYAWTPDDQGTHKTSTRSHRGQESLAIIEVPNHYYLTNPALSFTTQKDNYYQISGWMKGLGITDESCQFTIEFSTPAPNQKFTKFDKSYLDYALREHIKVTKEYNAPLNIGEFGTTKWTFTEEKGGLKYMEDLLNLFEKHDLNFQLWDYHSTEFGLYQNRGFPDPAESNMSLIHLLEKQLKN